MNSSLLETQLAKRPVWVGPALLAWAVAAFLLALSGGFGQALGPVPLTLVLGLALPVVAYLVLMRQDSGFRSWVDRLDTSLLVSLHAWRTVGLGFVMVAWFGDLHPAFAWPAGLGDALVAVWATALAHQMRSAPERDLSKTLSTWNFAGLADFALAVTLGVLLRPELGLVSAPGTAVMGQFPLALIPGFVVPFYVITHLALLRRLRVTSAAGNGNG